jgi:phage regulator Rha-like protein
MYRGWGWPVRKTVRGAGAWGLLNFQEIFFLDAYERQHPMFTMTKDGYAFLVGKMTGAGGAWLSIETRLPL